MINIHYYCTPRQAGKTNLALYEAFKSPRNLILAHNASYAKELSNRHPLINSMSYNEFARKMNGHRPIVKLILDEYHFANLHNKEKLYEYLQMEKHSDWLEDVTVFTTPRKQIPIELVEYVASCKAADGSLKAAIDVNNLRNVFPKWFLLPINVELFQLMIHELWWDLLFLQYSRHNCGHIRINFHDGQDHLPFFNYGTKERPYYDREMGVPEVEITGQYLVK